MTETIEFVLPSGTAVCLIIEGDWLSMPIQELENLRGLAALVRSLRPAAKPVAPVQTVETPAPKAVKRRARRNGRVDFAEVAKIYITAVAADVKPIDALCRHFGVERTVAKNWPTKCRQLGLLPPRNEPVSPNDAPTQFVSHANSRKPAS